VPTRIEFHDSTLKGCEQFGADVEIGLDAYVHRWNMVDGAWRGTGWVQPVRVLVSNVVGPWVAPVTRVDISSGRLRVGDVIHDNTVELPFVASDSIEVWLQLASSEVVELAGLAVRIEPVGEARYVEDLPDELRPGHAG
jgi:hypothetical protein